MVDCREAAYALLRDEMSFDSNAMLSFRRHPWVVLPCRVDAVGDAASRIKVERVSKRSEYTSNSKARVLESSAACRTLIPAMRA